MMIKVIAMTESERITSRDNRRLKFARRVRDGREAGYVFIEGRRLCNEAVKSGVKIESVFLTDEAESSADFAPKRLTYLLSEPLLKSIADTESPQGIVIVAKRPQQPKLADLFSATSEPAVLPVWIFLERINNPSNLGAIMRTAEAAGVRGLIVSAGSADPFSPKSIRASMGSAFRLPVANGVDLDETLEVAEENGIDTMAIASSGSYLYTEVNWSRPSLLVFGSEADGLPKETLPLFNRTVRISIERSVESLNLAVASGIVLFEARRQIQLPDR